MNNEKEFVNDLKNILITNSIKRIKNKRLKDCLDNLNKLIQEAKQIIKDRKSFDEIEFCHWSGAISLTETNLDRLFNDLLKNNYKRRK